MLSEEKYLSCCKNRIINLKIVYLLFKSLGEFCKFIVQTFKADATHHPNRRDVVRHVHIVQNFHEMNL